MIQTDLHPTLVYLPVAMSDASKPRPGANPASSSGPSAATHVDSELEQLLSKEASAFQREVEVERILKAFKLK